MLNFIWCALSYSTYILEGREGWPFVRLVERRFEDS
jgi:hypothetical protein